MPKYSINRQFGNLGEKLACQFLMKRHFKVIEQNYLKPWGEIDIIAQKGNKYHFVEVKSVSCEMPRDVIHETHIKPSDMFRPEENVHPQKLKRLYRTIESYLMENNLDNEWQLDIVTVRIDQNTRRGEIALLENIVGE
jgi:putative endonuclease